MSPNNKQIWGKLTIEETDILVGFGLCLGLVLCSIICTCIHECYCENDINIVPIRRETFTHLLIQEEPDLEQAEFANNVIRYGENFQIQPQFFREDEQFSEIIEGLKFSDDLN